MHSLTPYGPENDRPIKKKEQVLAEIEDAKREAKRLKVQSAIPLLKLMKDELIGRIKDGSLAKELKSKKAGSLIRDMVELKKLLDENVPLIGIMTPPAPASDGKDHLAFRSRSAVRMTDKDRAALRKQVESGEVIDAGIVKEPNKENQ